MKKVIVIQSPAKFYEAVPVFYKEAMKFGFLDKFYIVTDFPGPYDVGGNCHVKKLKKDRQFSSNMLKMLPEVQEDIFFVCCEDHIFMPRNDNSLWQKCFDFALENKSVGFLRLTNNDRVRLTSNDFFAPIYKNDPYYISLQPGIWRREYFEKTLQSGEDAWKFETSGAKRAKKIKNMSSFCVQETVFHRTNFFKEGKYYRHKFAEYAIRNNIKLGKRKIHWKGNLYSFDEYAKIYTKRQKK